MAEHLITLTVRVDSDALKGMYLDSCEDSGCALALNDLNLESSRTKKAKTLREATAEEALHFLEDVLHFEILELGGLARYWEERLVREAGSCEQS